MGGRAVGDDPPIISVAVGWAFPRDNSEVLQVAEAERFQVGLVPPARNCFMDREVAARLEEAAAEGGAVVLCQVLAGDGRSR